MASTYPVILQTGTIPSEMQVSNIVNQLIQHAEGDVSSLDLSILTDEDLASIMSVLELELQVDTSFLNDGLPENFPITDTSMYVLLPEWLDLDGSDTEILEFHSNSNSNENSGYKRF